MVVKDMNIDTKSTKLLFCLQNRKAVGWGNKFLLNHENTVMDMPLISRDYPVTVIDSLNKKKAHTNEDGPGISKSYFFF